MEGNVNEDTTARHYDLCRLLRFWVCVVCVCSSLALYATYPQQFKAALLRPAGTGTVAGLVVCVMRCDRNLQLLRPSSFNVIYGELKLSLLLITTT